MNTMFAHPNLVCAWAGITAGFVSGLLLGLGFDQDRWLGGYGSWKRRLYRLGHISFFGLALMNFVFYVTAQGLGEAGPWMGIASRAFIVGAVSMPLCCVLMAHRPKCRPLFAVPVLSLLGGATLTLLEVTRL